MDRLAAARMQALLLAAWAWLPGVTAGTGALANEQPTAEQNETPQVNGDADWPFVSLPVTLGAPGERVELTPGPITLVGPPGGDEPTYAVPTRLDRAGRVLAPITVNDKGPFRFILDTGANRSVVSQRVLAALALPLAPNGPSIEVHGVTGTAILPAVELEVLQAGELVLARDHVVPVLAQTVLANADGILGVEGLGSARIDIDFLDDRVTITRSSGRQHAPSGFLTIPVSVKHNGLIVVPGKVGRVRVRAIIDTGAERTLGNIALREALLKARRTATAEMVTTVFGATPDIGQGMSMIAPTIYLGEAELRDLEVTFGDLHVFRIWKLEDEPAILIGMDLLGSVERLVIDYRRRELQVKPRG
jgi:predicted aspartyl protease